MSTDMLGALQIVVLLLPVLLFVQLNRGKTEEIIFSTRSGNVEYPSVHFCREYIGSRR